MKPKNANIEFYLGIDISKADFHVALLRASDHKVIAQKTFPNHAKGYQALYDWLLKNTSADLPVHLCPEATGSYGDGVAFFFHRKAVKLSVVNPRAIKAHGASSLRRCKSDPADARLIADFCLEKQPTAWVAPTPAQQKVKAFSRRLTALKKSLAQEKNRRDTTTDKDILKDIKAHIRWIENHIEKFEAELVALTKADEQTARQLKLATSITGFGDKSAAHILAEIGDINIYQNARQLSAHAGITPAIFQSGKHERKYTRMTKAGNSHIRKMLFFPAMVAMQHNPICREFAARLEKQGKSKLAIIGAVMNKLLRILFGVLKHQKPFNPNQLKTTQN